MSIFQIVRPSEFQRDVLSESRFKVSLFPMQIGYAQTIGNCLRRVMLSSVSGYAVSRVMISNVSSEYDSISGVIQSVMEITMNLKKINIKSKLCKSFEIKKTFNKAGRYYAKDLINDDKSFEIINPNLFLFEVSRNDISFEMQLQIEYGVGYLEADVDDKNLDTGVISLDCNFNPVRNVAINVSQMHTENGQRFEKLTLDIDTNGCIECDDLISEAAAQMISFFEVLNVKSKDFKSLTKSYQTSTAKSLSSDELDDDKLKLCLEISSLELSVRPYKCLEDAGIKYIGDLVTKSENDLLEIQNLGRKSLFEIKDVIASKGLAFDMKISDWPFQNVEELKKQAKIRFNI